jgi:hypothetical protein
MFVFLNLHDYKRENERLPQHSFVTVLSRVLSGQRDNNNVDSSDLTRKFIGTIAEITHNRYYTHFRV